MCVRILVLQVERFDFLYLITLWQNLHGWSSFALSPISGSVRWMLAWPFERQLRKASFLLERKPWRWPFRGPVFAGFFLRAS